MLSKIKFDDYVNENKAEYNSKLPYIPDHRYRIIIIGSSGSEKFVLSTLQC